MTMRVAAKRLSRVEVSREASNQHEFNAGLLRKALELPTERISGDLEITYVTDDHEDAEVERCYYTLSNVRAGNPDRDEYHMYYSSQRLQLLAREGDILVLTRAAGSTDLRALIVRPGTALATHVEELLADDGVEITSRFRAISTHVRGTAAADFFRAAAEAAPVPSAEDFLRFADPAFISSAIDQGHIPGGKQMAAEAGAIVQRMADRSLDPDFFLQWRLDAETTLFQHLEKAIGQRELDALSSAGSLDFGDVTRMVLGRIQSRKSRRGQSLQNHFAALLDREGIPCGEQCTTEHGERPDFIIPGCKEYADAAFPAARLRMVACKSVIRERWAQILKEAERIPEKFLLTLDVGITDATIADLRRHSVRLFVPVGIAEAAYRHHDNRSSVESVTALIERLRPPPH